MYLIVGTTAKLIFKIAGKCDITISLDYISDFYNRKFTVRVANTDEGAHGMDELVPFASDCLQVDTR